MKVQEAVQTLKNHHYKVEKHKNGWIAVFDAKFLHDYSERELYTDRELIKLAQSVHKTHPGYKIVKEETHKPFRRKFKQQVAAENLEDFNNERKCSKNNIWYYD